MKAYRKAVYKNSKRNSVEVSLDYCNISIARYLFHKHNEAYMKIFGNTHEPLLKDDYCQRVFGVIRKSNKIIAVFLTETGECYSDSNIFEKISFSNEQERILNNYNVKR